MKILVVLICALPIGCTGHVSSTESIMLPSGEHIVLTDVHGDRFTDVNGIARHVYYVSYDTEHDFRNKATLTKEALRVWALYKPQIINEDYDTCVVTPMKTDAGGGKEGSPFYFKRASNGQWLLQP